MKTRRVLLVFLLVSLPVSAFADPKSHNGPQTVLQWQSENPSCFDSNLPLTERFESVPRFMVGGEMTEPEKIEGENPKTEHFEGIELRTGIPVVELVINPKGAVEAVLSLRTTTPQFDKRLGELISTWKFKPATLEGRPVCVRYILTIFIHYV